MRKIRRLLLLGFCWVSPAWPWDIALTARRVELPAQPALQHLQVQCTGVTNADGIHCHDGRFSVRMPELGKVAATFTAQLPADLRWTLRAQLTQHRASLAALQRLARGYGLAIPGTLTGSADWNATADLSADRVQWRSGLRLRALDYSEPSGRYAAEKWNVDFDLQGAGTHHWTLKAQSRSGQVYVEPLFLDFGALPLNAQATGRATPDGGWRFESASLQAGKDNRLTGSGRLDRQRRLRQMSVRLESHSMQALAQTGLQPFLIGTALEGLQMQGPMSAAVDMRDGQLTALDAQPQGLGVQLPKLDIALEGITGNLYWSAHTASRSALDWSGGGVKKITFGPARFRFETFGRHFRLHDTARIPLLGGALIIETLGLRNIGSAALQADFSGQLEPIALNELCRALGWPQFSGQLSGRLPGLHISDRVWQIDGALEAQAFDGQIRIGALQAIDPFGTLPRVAADIQLRRLDLEQLTGVFPIGRITGRLDGDIEGLRLLAWKPVAFDGRLYSTPEDDRPHRISQRAIDNISAIGGGPTGVLSRGFMSLFEDFAYDRMGLRCILRDGRCRMAGVEAADGTGGDDAYYIVKGRLLPRIDVIGHAHSVSWNTLLKQLDAARQSSGPQTQP